MAVELSGMLGAGVHGMPALTELQPACGDQGLWAEHGLTMFVVHVPEAMPPLSGTSPGVVDHVSECSAGASIASNVCLGRPTDRQLMRAK